MRPIESEVCIDRLRALFMLGVTRKPTTKRAGRSTQSDWFSWTSQPVGPLKPTRLGLRKPGPCKPTLATLVCRGQPETSQLGPLGVESSRVESARSRRPSWIKRLAASRTASQMAGSWLAELAQQLQLHRHKSNALVFKSAPKSSSGAFNNERRRGSV